VDIAGNKWVMANESDDDGQPEWLSLLGGTDVSHEPWVCLTPERVAMMALEDCNLQLHAAREQVDRLALAAKSGHMAAQAALTAALAGSANIGAHPPALKRRYLAHLDDRDGDTDRPADDRVMGFVELLATAMAGPLPWGDAPLILTSGEEDLLKRLTAIRHAIEHPKQAAHSIEPRYIAEALPPAAKVVVDMLGTVLHHMEPLERQHMRELQASISIESATYTAEG